MDNKTFVAEFKQFGEDGAGEAIFATTGVVDKDKDVTKPGAFGNQIAHVLPMHVWQDPDPPFLGVAQISEIGNEAVAKFSLNLELDRAQRWRNALKYALDHGKTVEWSYGFNVLKCSYGEFNGEQVRFLENLHVIEVSPCVQGAGEGTRTLDMKHNDASLSPSGEKGRTLEEQFEIVEAALVEASQFINREKALAALRAKEGRVLSARNREKIAAVLEQMRGMMAEMDMLLQSTEPKDPDKAAQLFAQYQRTLAQIAGHIG